MEFGLKRLGRWICNQEVASSTAARPRFRATFLGKPFVRMRLCHQAVQFGTNVSDAVQLGK